MARAREQLFVSYCRKDKKWLDKLQTMLSPLIQQDKLKIWDDSQIPPGSRWYDEIQTAIANASIAVLLVSADFIASNFIVKHELPMLNAAKEDGLRLHWIAVDYCMYRDIELADYQALNTPSAPLNSLSSSKQTKELQRICEKIKKELEKPKPETP